MDNVLIIAPTWQFTRSWYVVVYTENDPHEMIQAYVTCSSNYNYKQGLLWKSY